jgi:predicted transcriptional regulator
MSTVIEDVEAFRQYVLEHSRTHSTNASLEDLFQRWYASRLSEAELEQSLQSLRRGLADADAGRLVDADVAIQETRARLLRKS